jgi:NADH:ubiquinone oxidoreductase subunit 5 (subunit L)/multisubunit Na+/H+ antiporter MnhA subunit
MKEDKLNRKMKFLGNFLDFKERDYTIVFWFFSLATIPVFAYIYSLPIIIFTSILNSFINLNENIMLIINIITSFLFAFSTQYYLWKLFKGKKLKNNNLT